MVRSGNPALKESTFLDLGSGTVVSRDGSGIRRIESSWSHPLKRREDIDIVRRHIDLQHERVLDEIRRGPLQGPRRRTIWERDKRPGPAS